MRFVCVLFVLFLNVSAFADTTVDYFPVIPEEEVLPTLQDQGFKNCGQYLKKFFSKKDTKSFAMQAMAYDLGLCTEQDLTKAQGFYEKSIENSATWHVRLVLLYQFGPQEIRDPKRAEFLAKQTVIFLSPHTPEIRQGYIDAFLVGQPMPPIFVDALDWIEKTINQSEDEKREISKILKEDGYEFTEFIWNPINDIKPSVFIPYLPHSFSPHCWRWGFGFLIA